jgi:glycosyltransferase involved in cell wall biosynthesis
MTNHGLYSQTAPEEVFSVYLKTLGRWTLNQADLILTYTDQERQGLKDLGVRSNIAVVKNGIDMQRFSPNGSGSKRIDNDTPAILFVGRLVSGKRPIDTVRILAGIRERGIAARLYIAGEGPLESKLRTVASELGVEEAVTFLGRIPYEEMPSLYRSADLLVLTSRNEGLPRTILEAMASGTPVVSSDIPQLKDLVESAGRTVPIEDQRTFVDAVGDILDGEAPRTNSEDHYLFEGDYTWRGTVEDTTKHLESLL